MEGFIHSEWNSQQVLQLKSYVRQENWDTRCIQKFPDWVQNEINNNKHSLRNNVKGYGDKTHYTDLQNSETTAPNGTEL